MSKFSKDIQDMVERAFWTFVQTFAAVYTVTSTDEIKSAVTAGVAAALSVIKTYSFNKLKEKNDK